MMRSRSALLAAALMLLPASLRALPDTADAVTAATLLLPRFEVVLDADDPNGLRTKFTVHNGGAAPAIAHVTLWSDFGLPVINFDLPLAGFGVQEVRLFDVFVLGELPQNSECDPPAIESAAARAAHARAAAIGSGQGGGNVAVGFITIDSTNECSDTVPGDAGYFVSGGLGIANNLNILWGDYQLIHRDGGFAASEPLVAIEAATVSAPLQRGSVGPGFSFYSTWRGTNGADQRERLSPRWGGSYDTGEGAATDVIVWREPQEFLLGRPRGAGGVGFGQSRLVVYGDSGDSADITGFQAFPLATNRTTVGGPTLPTPFDSGWLFLDVSTAGGGGAISRGVALESQGHMTVLRRRPNGETVAVRGIDLRMHNGPPEL